jgi:hypothetical protein
MMNDDTNTPSTLRDSVQWPISPIAGSILTSVPANAKGRAVVFTYSGLPDSNSQFGPKYVYAALPQYGVAEAVLIKTYFPKRALNHPASGGQITPNWYYYWEQTAAAMGTQNQRQYSGPLCSRGWAGYLDNVTFDYYHICDTSCTQSYILCDQRTWDGIDLFAAECRHEYEHLIDYALWWPNGWIQADDLDGPDTLTGYYGDGIPDTLEGYNHLYPQFSPFRIDSDSNGVRDWDELCDSTKCTWNKGQGDYRDWSNPGHQ